MGALCCGMAPDSLSLMPSCPGLPVPSGRRAVAGAANSNSKFAHGVVDIGARRTHAAPPALGTTASGQHRVGAHGMLTPGCALQRLTIL